MPPLTEEPRRQPALTPKRLTLLALGRDPAALDAAERLVRELGFDLIYRDGARGAAEEIGLLRPDAVLCDLPVPAKAGMETLRAIREAAPCSAVILLTGQTDLDAATEALRLGVIDCLTRPLHPDRLRAPLTAVAKGIERREMLLRRDAEAARQLTFHGIIGRSAAMQELFDACRRFSPHLRAALITGEAGTGKELAARAIHRVGNRGERPFVTMPCSATDPTLFESALFGHQRGAFAGAIEARTGAFEQADGGTLFLDEIGAVPISIQLKLVRAIEYGEVQRMGARDAQRLEVCVIAATRRDLRAEVAAGRVRRDLWDLLRLVQFAVPPLRQRRDDIPLLAAAFIEEFGARTGAGVSGMTTGAERALQHASWEGNVRELKDVIERACAMNNDRLLGERDILAALASAGGPVDTPGLRDTDNPDLLSSAQRRQIERVLKRVGGNKTEAARLLGISRRALYRWLERLGLATRK
jgi:two-component system response regulator HydG